MTDLGSFEGASVRSSSLVVRNLGDGLSDAMKVEPAILHRGEEVTIVVRGTVADVQFPPIDKEDPGGDCTRKHVIRAKEAMIVDLADVDKMLEMHHERLVAARDAERGQGAFGRDEGSE